MIVCFNYYKGIQNLWSEKKFGGKIKSAESAATAAARAPPLQAVCNVL